MILKFSKNTKARTPVCSNAFTLAEVLITLGIIGVVAAITLPSIIQNHRKHVVETRLKKFYSVANQAIMLSEVKNGPKEDWAVCAKEVGTSLTSSCEEWYNIYLKDFLNTIQVKHFNDNNLDDVTGAYFEDGSLMLIKRGYDIYFYPFAKDFNQDKFLRKEDDGSLSRPDCGKKYFAFVFAGNSTATTHDLMKGKGIEPCRTRLCKTETDESGNTTRVCDYNLTHDELLNNSLTGCNKSAPYKSYCTALIQENGWKIPKDYPFKF